MHYRKKYIKGNIVHVCNKSIANYNIFTDEINSLRFLKTLIYYNNSSIKHCLSTYLRNKNIKEDILSINSKSLVKVIAFCIMQDHYHLLLKILKDKILSKYISNIENSFSRYFNCKFNRKGPLWQSRFKSILVKNNNQLLHLTRYIHLNPTTSNLVDKPEKLTYSSYKEYTHDYYLKNFLRELTIGNKNNYQKFCNDRIDYQRKLKLIKKHLLD